MSTEQSRRDTELITLVQLSKDYGIPLRTLKSAIAAGRMWGKKQGRDWTNEFNRQLSGMDKTAPKRKWYNARRFKRPVRIEHFIPF